LIKKTGESNTFIDNLTKKNLSIKVIEKLSDSTISAVKVAVITKMNNYAYRKF